MKKKIALGVVAKDASNGITGTVIAMVEQVSGSLRWSVQPKSADGTTLPDAWDIDHNILDYVDAGVSKRAVPPNPSQVIPLGSSIKDRISGETGVATTRVTHLNGCVYYKWTPSKKSSSMFDGPAGSVGSPEGDLELLSLPPVIRAKEVSPEKPGGPTTKSARL